MEEIGPLFVGLEGLSVTQEEVEILKHPLVGGVILFQRNYQSPEQIIVLTNSIRCICKKLLIMVDQEGGCVQRFKNGFVTLPSMRSLGNIYEKNYLYAKKLAWYVGWLTAMELKSVGIDLNISPVLDIDYGRNQLISKRAFHFEPSTIINLACMYLNGMSIAGMCGIGKHFPGHGFVTVDSHLKLPIDNRSYNEMFSKDIFIFNKIIEHGLHVIMTAHILYPTVDKYFPATFSEKWLKCILRNKIGFRGIIISDDLDMNGAKSIGYTPSERARIALAAGCNIILSCNDRAAAVNIIDNLGYNPNYLIKSGLSIILRGQKSKLSINNLRHTKIWQYANRLISSHLA